MDFQSLIHTGALFFSGGNRDMRSAIVVLDREFNIESLASLRLVSRISCNSLPIGE